MLMTFYPFLIYPLYSDSHSFTSTCTIFSCNIFSTFSVFASIITFNM